MAGVNGVDPLDSANVQHKLSADTRNNMLILNAQGIGEGWMNGFQGTSFRVPLYFRRAKLSGTQVFDVEESAVPFPHGCMTSPSSSMMINAYSLDLDSWSDGPFLNDDANNRNSKRARVIGYNPQNIATDQIIFEGFVLVTM